MEVMEEAIPALAAKYAEAGGPFCYTDDVDDLYEGNTAFYHFGLADPTISENVRRARRFAAMFMDEDPEAPTATPDTGSCAVPYRPASAPCATPPSSTCACGCRIGRRRGTAPTRSEPRSTRW